MTPHEAGQDAGEQGAAERRRPLALRLGDTVVIALFFASVMLAALPMGANRDWAWAADRRGARPGGKLRQGGEHHADNLMAGLRFLPQYTRGSRLRFLFVRTKWRVLGIGRLFSGRWILNTSVYDLSFRDKCRMFLAGAARLAPWLPGIGR